MPITSTGIGSGLDVETLVSQLVLAETQPQETRLITRETQLQAEISAFGLIKSALSTFQTSAESAGNASNYQAKSVSITDYTKMSGSATAGAAAGTYDITVSSLAAKQSLASTATYASTSATVGTGKLTITSGTTVYNSSSDTYTSFTQKSGTSPVDITIDSSNNTLAGVRDAINASSANVSASIVYDGSNYRLVIASDSEGAENSVSITTDDDDGNDTNAAGLSNLAFNASATNLAQTQAASDANLTINGLAVTSSSNTVTTAVEELSFTLKETFSETETITVSHDASQITSTVQGFVDGYNELIDAINQQTSYDADAQISSTLTGDSTLRALVNQIRSSLNASVFNPNADYEYLASVGIKTDAITGKFELDSTVLDKAIAADPDDVAVVFANFAKPSASNVEFSKATSATEEGSYALTATTTNTQGSWTAGAAVTDFSYQGGGGTNAANFRVTVDGSESADVTISSNLDSGGSLDSAQLISEIQSQLDSELSSTSATVSISNDVITITSGSSGAASSISVTNPTSDPDTAGLGLNSGTATDGTTTVNYFIDGVAATLDGNVISAAAGTAAEGLQLKVLGNASSNLGTVYYSQGLASKLDTLIDQLLSTDGLIEAKISGLESSVDDLDSERDRLELRASNLEDIYRSQFNSLETLISSINETGTFLSQAFATSFIEPMSFRE